MALMLAVALLVPGEASSSPAGLNAKTPPRRMAQAVTGVFDRMIAPLREDGAGTDSPADGDPVLESRGDTPAAADAASWEALGDSLLQSAEGEEVARAAMAAYSAAALYDNDPTSAQRKLAYLLMSENRFGPALMVFEEFLPRTAADPDWLDLSSACILYARLNRLERGTAFLEHMLLLYRMTGPCWRWG